ncbi:hypothetical protein [Luteococcus sp.]|uniref:hypothetical protein n=1 Tax=Luteococcus sp. TaxID=1969402 RepID=UPI003735F20A
MAVIVLTSAAGSPGVTTSALGLALQWPRDVLLVDADRDPAQALQSGWLRGADLAGRGLAALAGAHREHRSLSEELWLQTIPLDQQPDQRTPETMLEAGDEARRRPERRFLPGFTHPGAVSLFTPVWQGLCDALLALDQVGTDVLVDAGRIGRDGLPESLVAAADLALVTCRSSLPSLAGVRLHLPTLQAQAEGAATHVELLVVGPNRPYASAEIGTQFGCPGHSLAWEPRHAAVLSDGSPPPRGLGQGALARSHRALASSLAEQSRRRSEVVAGTRSSQDWGK